jgi:hypothetical protein
LSNRVSRYGGSKQACDKKSSGTLLFGKAGFARGTLGADPYLVWGVRFCQKKVGEQYLCATRSPTMPRPLRARHSRDAARARSHHRNRLRAAPQGRRRHSSSSLHVLRFLGAAPCICACNQIEWLLASSALWDGSAAGGGACSALVGLHPLAPLLRASLGAHAALLVTCCACYQIEWLLAS